ncbi:hypothetical protein QZM37_26395 [Burkholderia orbicola]|nr:hypothetical protein [Burkholderia orbicola]
MDIEQGQLDREGRDGQSPARSNGGALTALRPREAVLEIVLLVRTAKVRSRGRTLIRTETLVADRVLAGRRVSSAGKVGGSQMHCVEAARAV